MPILNIEIKAGTKKQTHIREALGLLKATFKGIDYQTDTYFNVHSGRLKLREGNIENHLIHYQRENQSGPRSSEVLLYKTQAGSAIKEILTKALGILVVVNKKREIYFIDNVKFHIDEVDELGYFVEIEAIDKNGTIGRDALQEQCTYYMKLFDIAENELVPISYSDMLLKTNILNKFL